MSMSRIVASLRTGSGRIAAAPVAAGCEGSVCSFVRSFTTAAIQRETGPQVCHPYHKLIVRSSAPTRPLLLSAYRCSDPRSSTLHSSAWYSRAISTQSDQKDPVLKYFGHEDDHISPQEYKIRVGTAIRALRVELPRFFQDGVRTKSIYASNIRLIEASHTNVTLQGKPIYLLLAGAVRWSFKMWFRDLEFEIQSIRVNGRGGTGLKGMDSGGNYDGAQASFSSLLSISSPHSTLANTTTHFTSGTATFGPMTSKQHIAQLSKPSDCTEHHHPTLEAIYDAGTIDRLDGTVGSAGIGNPNNGKGAAPIPTPPATIVTVRWTMKGTTRPSVVLTSSGPTPPPPSSYEGVFVYEFNDHGLIDEHRIENIMPSPSPEAIQRAFAWWGWLLSRTRPAAAAASDEVETRKRLGLGYIANR